MADLKKDVEKKLKDIKKTVSNEDEMAKVMSIVLELVEGFEEKLSDMEQRQTMLEEKTGEIMDMLSDMEEELVTALNEEFEAECPYCGEVIPFKVPEDEEEFECPKCHNTIELEMLFNEDGCDCDDCKHGDCDHKDCDCQDHDDEEK